MRQDLSGKKFGRLTVLGDAGHKASSPDTFWHCVCECGKFTVTAGGKLRSGKAKSCGCIHGLALHDPVEHGQLLQLLKYDRESGLFLYLRDSKRAKVNDIAGFVDRDSKRVVVRLGGVSYYAHILAYFYICGEWPSAQIDHADGNPTNNSFDNLRLATSSQNIANSKRRSDNSTGYKGVSKKGQKYAARVRARQVGRFNTVEEAAQAYDDKARELYGEFARTNFEVV